MDPLSAEEIRCAVVLALAEDIGAGDVTSLATVPEHALAKAEVRAREPLVVAGLALAEAAFRECSARLEITRTAEDGQRIAKGKPRRVSLRAFSTVQPCSGLSVGIKEQRQVEENRPSPFAKRDNYRPSFSRAAR